MVDLIVGLIVLAMVGSASYYIYSQKKKGRKCIGCPEAGNCQKMKK